MNLSRHPLLEALCGEYLLGTLRGAARRRFERSIREEPLVALQLREMTSRYAVTYKSSADVQPSSKVWQRLALELDLERYRTPWHRRVGLWRVVAAASTAALALTIGVQTLRPFERPEPLVTIARLQGKAQAQVSAALARDGRTLELRADRPVLAGATQSYELWLIGEAGGAPVSLAVLGSLDTRVTLPPERARRIATGAKLAISVEPAGGSPTGQPTGPVILIGEVAI